MKISVGLRHFALVLTGLISCGASIAAEVDASAGTVRIGGSGGPLPTLALLGEAFKKTHPQAAFIIVPSLGSGGGVKALRAGAIDLAVISRPLKDTELQSDIKATEYARTPFVFAAGVSTPAVALTTSELVRIYNGETKTWPDGHLLRLVLRPQTESDTEIVQSLSTEMNQAVKTALGREGMNMAVTDKASADSLEKIPGALGTTTLVQIISEKRALQALTLNGVAPSLSTLAQGKYPHFKTFSLVTRTSANPLIGQFVAFMRSAAGQEILEQNGHQARVEK